ncbi:MAG: ATPase P, partial [Bacteroidota bacterium]
RFIAKLQGKGERVMMIGDGLNDAGALQQSNIGLVVSENCNNFTPASDVILAADQLVMLPDLVRYIERCKYIVIAAFALALLYNLVGLSFAVSGLLSPVIAAILMPLSSISIVVVATLGSWLMYVVTLKKNREGDKIQ